MHAPVSSNMPADARVPQALDGSFMITGGNVSGGSELEAGQTMPTAPSEMSYIQLQPLTEGNDQMSYNDDVIQRNREDSMSYVLSVRLPTDFVIKLDAEMEESRYRSLSETVRELLQFALDVRHREK
jgi:hypothetical protein